MRDLTVDFNRAVDDDLIRANARRAVQGTVLDVGCLVAVGDDDWGVASAEVVKHDRGSGSLVLRLLGEIVDERSGEFSAPHEARPAEQIDLVADLNAQDDDGHGWSLLSRARDPSAVKVGAMLLAGNPQAVAVVRVMAVDDDGQVHFTILPASIDKNRHLLDCLGARQSPTGT